MKNPIAILLLFAICLASSCADKPARPDAILSQDRIEAADNAAAQAQTAGIQAAPTTAGGVQHYYCANNCEGSGGDAQGNCPTCGTPYTHNAAFHNQPQVPTQITPGTTTLQTNPTSATAPNNIVTTPAQPQQDLPATNAQGVYHYTCSNGCAGGAAGAGSCQICGGALAHNQAYHN